MKALKHKWRRFAFKCILSVTGLVLFTAQVSYKFYRSSSMAVLQTGAEAGFHTGYRTFSAKSHTSSLTLDKRFDLQDTFALLSPFFSLPAFDQPEPLHIRSIDEKIISR